MIVVDASLFGKVDNNCYVQLSGFPIHDLPDTARVANAPPPTIGKRKRDGHSDRCAKDQAIFTEAQLFSRTKSSTLKRSVVERFVQSPRLIKI